MPLIFPNRNLLPARARPPTLVALKDRLLQPPYGWPRRRAAGGKSFHDVLVELGQTTDLKLCLDAGAAASYDGSSQTWADLTSTQDFHLGADAAVATDDPRFDGTAGKASADEHFSYDGGDEHRAKAHPAWANEPHKDGAKWGAVFFMRQPAAGAGYFCGTSAPLTSNVGFILYLDTAQQFVGVQNGSGSTNGLQKFSTAAVAADAVHMVAYSIDENGGANGGFLYLDGAYNPVGGADTWDANYTTPSAAASTDTLSVGRGGASNYVNNGTRFYAVAFWQGTAPTKANFDAVWDAMRGRFGV